jgi:hypothetical protein
MKKYISIIAFVLFFSIILPSCTEGSVQPEISTQAPDSTQITEAIEDILEPETTAEPEPNVEKRYLIDPYIDIEFNADGGITDAKGHVDCSV